jgi:hypothetical protein
MLDASVNRILHRPTTRLRESALADLESPSLGELTEALEHLFGLDEGPDVSEPGGEVSAVAELPSGPNESAGAELASAPAADKVGVR